MAAHLEDIIAETGGCGRYQMVLCLIVHSCKLVMIFGFMFMAIGAKVPDWWCVDDYYGDGVSPSLLSVNSTGYKSCSNSNGTACQRYIFDELKTSIVPQWELVCANDWIPATIMSVQMAGIFVGNIAGGHAADLIGRKPTLYAAIAVTSVSMIISIFSTSWIMFTVLRFFIGLASGFQGTVMYNIQLEFVLPRWRTWVVAMPSWHIALIIFAIISWGLDDWKYIHATGAVVGVVGLFTYWYVPESFRWKVVHDHVKDARKIIKFVAKINRRSVPSDQVLDELATSVRHTDSHTDHKFSLLDLFKSKAILKNSGLLLVVWITLGLGTNGIQFNIQALSGSVYANICIVAAINCPLQFLVIYLQNRFGRKITNILHFAAFAVAAAAVGIIDQFEDSDLNQTISRAFTLVALVVINAVWSPVQTHTIELYPTVIRNIGYGLQNTMARVGSIMGPQLLLLDATFPGTMFFVCAGLGVLAIIVVLPLPETKGVDLEDNMPDMHSLEALQQKTLSKQKRIGHNNQFTY